MSFIVPPIFKDYETEIVSRNIAGARKITIFGQNPSTVSAAGYETVQPTGGVYPFLSTAELVDVSSTAVTDVGTIAESGTLDSGTGGLIVVDDDATFITNGVAQNDFFYNYTNSSASIVLSVDSETQLTLLIEPVELNFGDTIPNEGGIPVSMTLGDEYQIIQNTSTGASAVHIWGLDSAGLEQSEVVVLNGTTDVPTTREFYRINRVRMAFSASRDGADGTITCVGDVSASLLSTVVVGDNQSMTGVFTTPSNINNGILRNFSMYTSPTTNNFIVETRIRIAPVQSMFYSYWPVISSNVSMGIRDDNLTKGFHLTPFVDVVAESSSSKNGVTVMCNMEFLVFV